MIRIVLLSFVCSFSLISCQKEKDQENQSSQTQSEPENQQPKQTPPADLEETKPKRVRDRPSLSALLTRKSEIKSVRSDFTSIQHLLETYKLHGQKGYPTEAQGLLALVARPDIPPIPKDWIIQCPELPRDAWGTCYRYKMPGTKDPAKPEIISAGPDQKFGTADDLSSQAKD